ncbi:SWI/SNF-related matrix-associated actin-dependent regulator of chromatin subfamily D member 1 isoform X1 [Oncorhynchus kisutch]|uniref:SWI/SNF related BAF chromatin remodeling complex subunit D1 n=1 Tax=Oncorhynchus kisutch TaxID=8019 RepID=A0A8C7GF40_ONCKI|nr:SWI/SNF-related matrix-associated actin-dependent regulator of chromatin subfamily D member 1 isoform X1 [Oncorhynchus kisutch]
MAARGSFQSASTGGGGGGMGPGPPVQGGGPGMGPGTPGGRMGPSSGAQNHLYRSPMPGPGYPRPGGMPPSSRMTPQGPPMGPPGYGSSPVSRPGMPSVMDPSRKRPAPQQIQQVQQQRNQHTKKKKMADKILPQRIRELVPESQAYMDLLAFERKLDQTIMRKRLDIQEALKRPIKQKRKLRIFISNTFNPAKPDAEDGDGTVASWELRVEGRLLEDTAVSKYEATKQKRKFSSFFKSLVIELDKDLYGPDNHLVEWHRTATTQETDGFQVKRPGDVGVRCTVLLMLDYQPPQFKLDPRLARMLGIHTQTRPVIIQALWQYVKTHKLQDPHEREFINCDKYLQQVREFINCDKYLQQVREFINCDKYLQQVREFINCDKYLQQVREFINCDKYLQQVREFINCDKYLQQVREFINCDKYLQQVREFINCDKYLQQVREFINCDKYLQQIFEAQRMKFSEIPQRLHALLMPPEPIIINHVISVDPNDQKKTACYDIDVEVDDTLKTQMNSFLLSTASQQEIAGLDNKIHETIETINQLKTQREFMLSFARDPQGFINDWLQSQCRDLKTMTDVVANPEEERRAEFYFQPWAQEAVCRYFYSKVQQRRQELEQALGIRNT